MSFDFFKLNQTDLIHINHNNYKIKKNNELRKFNDQQDTSFYVLLDNLCKKQSNFICLK